MGATDLNVSLAQHAPRHRPGGADSLADAYAEQDLSNVDPGTGRAALGLGTAAMEASTAFDAAGAADAVQAATTTALASKADLVGGLIPTSQIPAIALDQPPSAVPDIPSMLALTGVEPGKLALVGNPVVGVYVLTQLPASTQANWFEMSIPSAAVSSVNGHTGVVVLGFADVGALSATDPAVTNSRTPDGPAGGDLTGSYPNPSVASLDGVAVPTSAPAGANYLLVSTGPSGSKWSAPITATGTATGLAAGAAPTIAIDYSAFPALAFAFGIPQGIPGLTAYQLAVQLGYTGTETQWLASLHGDASLPAPYTANISGAYTIDPANGAVQVLTATGNATLSMAAVPAGAVTPLTVILRQDATAGRTITVPSATSTPPVLWPQGAPPTPATTVGAEMWLYLVGVTGLGWRGFMSGAGMA